MTGFCRAVQLTKQWPQTADQVLPTSAYLPSLVSTPSALAKPWHPEGSVSRDPRRPAEEGSGAEGERAALITRREELSVRASRPLGGPGDPSV